MFQRFTVSERHWREKCNLTNTSLQSRNILQVLLLPWRVLQGLVVLYVIEFDLCTTITLTTKTNWSTIVYRVIITVGFLLKLVNCMTVSPLS